MTGSTAAALGVAFAAGGYQMPDARAADLSYMPPPQPVPAMWSWSGPYVGLHVGTLDGDVEGDPFFGKDKDPESTEVLDPNGVLGGVQAGYNFQFDSLVVGLEGDVSFGDVDDVVYPFGWRNEAQIDWMATLRARAGWAMDRTLFYATGGIAFTELELTIDFGEGFKDSDKNSMLGWTVGGGVEYALTDHVSMKAEYLYADFGSEEYEFSIEGEGSMPGTTISPPTLSGWA